MKYHSLLFLLICVVTVSAVAAAGFVSPAPGYHITKKSVLGGEGGWDYLYCDSTFSSNGEGTLTVVHEDSPDKFTVAESVPTQRGARTMTLDQKTHRLFSVSAKYGPTPAPTTERPRPRAPLVPGTFTLLVLEK